MRPYPFKAFSLAELLIAVAIIGVLATFTAPKILGMNKSGDKYNRVVNDASYMVYSAYQTYKMEGKLTSSTSLGDFTPYMNYVSLQTTGQLNSDQTWTSTNIDCSNAAYLCLRLHNGAVIHTSMHSFGGTGSTNAFPFLIDPDGQYTSTPEARSVSLFLYYDGRIKSYADITPNTKDSTFTYVGTCPNCMPPWFSWQ